MNKIIWLVAIVSLLILREVTSLNDLQSRSISLFQKDFRKGRIAC